MKIKLSNIEHQVLLDLLNFSKKEFDKKIGIEHMSFYKLQKMNLIKNNSNFFIDNDVGYIRDLRDVVGTYLQIADSFDRDHNPTEIGIAIESLIDKFYV